uniref:Branchpoint-bridging protein n=1 Tax=Noccaea caerulescens TaxID=107243 RepID=A0A1J3D7R9_NOCCA
MTSTSGAKISMFGAKSGFVIPKNKLSGSLIPIFQRGKAPGGSDTDNGLLAKLGKRKTKWGPDLTQDTAVKKARVLAYQKRLDQITQKLESGALEAEANRESDIAEQLDIEKREVIGEILELNPRYKAPPDYKPLLKGARLPINVKEHSDFSFLSLIFGSQGDTLKRLEKETGAKVQIFGTKTGGEKVELSPSDEIEIQTSWQELYFQISSETYEKVDAAIAVIELLISSVSGNTGADAAPASSRSEEISTIPGNSDATATDPSSEQPTNSSVQPPQSQFQQHGSSFPSALNQNPLYPPPNPSAPSLGNRIQDPELPTNSMNHNPLFSQQPLPIPHNTSLPPGSQVPRPPDLFSFTLSSTPRAYPVVAPTPQGSLASPYSGGQMQPIGPRSTMRPSTVWTSQPTPSSVFRSTPLPDIVSSNMAQSVRPLAPNFSAHPIAHQPVSSHIAGRPAGLVPTYPSINPPTNTAPRPFHGDFGFLPQPQISPRPNLQSAHLPHLPHLAFQAPSVTPASHQFEQSFIRSQHFGRQMDQPLGYPPAQFHGNVRSSNLQDFGPPLPPMMPRNFPGAQFPQHPANFPPRPLFHHDNLIPRGQQQLHHRFNAGVHQVYDPFSPSDA